MIINNMLHEKVIRVLEEIGHTKRDQEMEAEVERGLQSVVCYSHLAPAPESWCGFSSALPCSAISIQ